MEPDPDTTTQSKFERFLAILQAAISIGITLFIWAGVSRFQDTWPLPAFYFLELVTGSLIILVFYFLKNPDTSWVTWIINGIVTSFIILASFSVGLAYIPVLIVLLVLGIYSDLMQRKSIFIGIGFWLLGGLLQSIIILAVARTLFRS